jgi:hypothetical protein
MKNEWALNLRKLPKIRLRMRASLMTIRSFGPSHDEGLLRMTSLRMTVPQDG